jgi:hypothetical protein
VHPKTRVASEPPFHFRCAVDGGVVDDELDIELSVATKIEGTASKKFEGPPSEVLVGGVRAFEDGEGFASVSSESATESVAVPEKSASSAADGRVVRRGGFVVEERVLGEHGKP